LDNKGINLLDEQTFDIWGYCPSAEKDALIWAEKGGRICYQSEGKITDTSALPFIQDKVNRGHHSVLEASNLVIKGDPIILHLIFHAQKYFKLSEDSEYVSGNLRAWLEYLKCGSIAEIYTQAQMLGTLVSVEDTPPELRRLSVLLHTSRVVTHEVVRHRVMSFLQESQRYCSYKDKVDIIAPFWLKRATEAERLCFMKGIEDVIACYHSLLTTLSPQEARAVLPNATAAYILITGYTEDFKTLLNLRTSKAADPNIRELMINLMARLSIALHGYVS
jgi:thymidylate synthase (FAD)